MVSSTDRDIERFNGSNWQALNRAIALAKFAFAQDEDYEDNEPRKCAYLASQFDGSALDWVAAVSTSNSAALGTFDGFIEATRQAFGIADNNITALIRRDLDQLMWQADVPVFFAEFDRLTLALGITSHETRVAMVEQKLPMHMKTKLAEQALSFSNYDTMRERLNMMWAMDPTRGKTVTQGKKKARCATCGKKGHASSECRNKSKNSPA